MVMYIRKMFELPEFLLYRRRRLLCYKLSLIREMGCSYFSRESNYS